MNPDKTSAEDEQKPELHVEKMEEAEELVPVEEVKDEMTIPNVTLVLGYDQYATVLSRILSFLDTPSVKKASLVSR